MSGRSAPREYLTPKEVERLIETAKKRTRRYGLRDATMILVAFRHGLRVSRALRADVGSDRFRARHDASATRQERDAVGAADRRGRDAHYAR
jgi:integrase